LLGQIGNRLASVSANVAYDREGVYEAVHAQGQGRHVRVLIPPRRDAQLSPAPSVASMERSRNVGFIRGLDINRIDSIIAAGRRTPYQQVVFGYDGTVVRNPADEIVDWE
jgi:hypothetical protein